jgi:hypothetical protein
MYCSNNFLTLPYEENLKYKRYVLVNPSNKSYKDKFGYPHETNTIYKYLDDEKCPSIVVKTVKPPYC